MSDYPVITASRLTPETWAPFGDIVAADNSRPSRDANFGTARRYMNLASLQNLRGQDAEPNLSLYRCEPAPPGDLFIGRLERHAKSTQVFVPIGTMDRYALVVAPPGDAPDPSAIAAFIVDRPIGISYHPGVWHHPMIALGTVTDFVCWIYEDGTDADCEVVTLPRALRVRHPKSTIR